MKEIKQQLDASYRRTIRLAEVERLLKEHRIIVPPLSRPTLVKLCQDGTLETSGGAPTKVGWLVYEDSFWEWVKSL